MARKDVYSHIIHYSHDEIVERLNRWAALPQPSAYSKPEAFGVRDKAWFSYVEARDGLPPGSMPFKSNHEEVIQ